MARKARTASPAIQAKAGSTDALNASAAMSARISQRTRMSIEIMTVTERGAGGPETCASGPNGQAAARETAPMLSLSVTKAAAPSRATLRTPCGQAPT